MKKLIVILIAVCFLAMQAVAMAASVEVCEKTGDFVCNVILNDKPVKEVNGVVVVPFESEYKLLLKNNNHRRASAHITIDGSPISSMGDLIIPAHADVTLERFITESLDRGKKFKFVPLDHPDVDDPGRAENGEIRVEFKLEQSSNIYIITEDDRFWHLPFVDFAATLTTNNSSVKINSTVTSSAEPGATIGGGESKQKFHKTEFEAEDKVFVIELKLKGVTQ